MADEIHVTVPEGYRCVLVSNDLVDRYADWTLIQPCEAKAASPSGGPVQSWDAIVEVHFRTVAICPECHQPVPHEHGT